MMNLKPGQYVRRMTFHLVTQAARKKTIRVLPTYNLPRYSTDPLPLR